MTLELREHWLWDFWLATDGDRHHVFYLQAPRSLTDPDERHWNATVGHAVSTDLENWEVLPDALAPGPLGAFDDLSTWTGSVVARDQSWAMLYTGTSHAERGLVQRIGLATSPDLDTWSQTNKAVLEADALHYEMLDLNSWHDLAWRDPWIVTHPGTDEVEALFTARSNRGDKYDRGVVGRARSRNLLDWEVLEPWPAPPGFGQLEVPQLLELEGRWYLLFSSDLETQSMHRRRNGAGTGTYYLVGDSPEGPFEMIGDGVLEADRIGSTYAGRIHDRGPGDPCFLAWERSTPEGDFVGRLASPRSVRVRGDGALELQDQVIR